MKFFLVIMLFSMVCLAQKVVVISNTRATKLKGKETMDDLYFNPIKDSLGRWCVSKEEIDQLTDSAYLYLKTLPLIEFIRPRDTTTIFIK